MKLKGYFILLILFYFLSSVKTQTCCSGGIPISSSLGLPIEKKGTLQITGNYDLNELTTLKSGRETLEDSSRRRRTHAAMLQMGYNLTNRISIDGMFSWIKQERRISQFNNTSNTNTHGIGDIVLLFKYQLYKSNNLNTQIIIGSGIKAPLGKTNLKTEDGFSIGADLQPGSGSWDGIFWGQFIQNSIFRPSLSFSSTATYSLKGSNPNYLGAFNYRFGNDFSILLTAADRVNISGLIIDPSLSIRYRNARMDILNEGDIPSTGGSWWFIAPSLSYWVNPNLGFNLRLEIPMMAKIIGTQLSPTTRYNIGFIKKISLSNNTNIISPLINIK